MVICPGHIVKTIKRVKIVKWNAFLKEIDFSNLTFLNIDSHLTIFTRLMVFITWRGHIAIVKWNWRLNDFALSHMF